MEQLRKLHHSAGQKAQAASIAMGVIGALLLGTGMSLCMTELGAALGQLAMVLGILVGLIGLVLGILVGLIGLVLVALAYPLYQRTLRKERARIAPEILRLTDELLK